MTPEKFQQLARDGYNRIPVTREVLADLDTPLSTYLKLANGPYSYLFESVQGGEKWGRYSIIGMACRSRIEVRGKQVQINTDGEVVSNEHCADPLAFIEDYLAQFKVMEADYLPKYHLKLNRIYQTLFLVLM